MNTYRADHLNLLDQCVTLILKYGHYDLLYPSALTRQYPFLTDYDSLPMSLYADPSMHLECVSCRGKTSRLDEIVELETCGHVYHKRCLAQHVERVTANRVFFTKTEKRASVRPTCMQCKSLIKDKDYEGIFDKRVLECYQTLRDSRERREELEKIQGEETKYISSIEASTATVPDTVCTSCAKPIRVTEICVLDCSHAYHVNCLKNCIVVQSAGKIFLTEAERAEAPIECVDCHEEIGDSMIEGVFNDSLAAIKYYKEERQKRQEETKDGRKWKAKDEDEKKSIIPHDEHKCRGRCDVQAEVLQE